MVVINERETIHDQGSRLIKTTPSQRTLQQTSSAHMGTCGSHLSPVWNKPWLCSTEQTAQTATVQCTPNASKTPSKNSAQCTTWSKVSGLHLSISVLFLWLGNLCICPSYQRRQCSASWRRREHTQQEYWKVPVQENGSHFVLRKANAQPLSQTKCLHPATVRSLGRSTQGHFH